MVLDVFLCGNRSLEMRVRLWWVACRLRVRVVRCAFLRRAEIAQSFGYRVLLFCGSHRQKMMMSVSLERCCR
jgi:hypothetical protein